MTELLFYLRSSIGAIQDDTNSKLSIVPPPNPKIFYVSLRFAEAHKHLVETGLAGTATEWHHFRRFYLN